uniref:DDE Tnp4 domain-containing protein n=1 Tax=Pelusios castaneus TaxID=367368 RepID=A0A8C8RPP7_9SAUR
MWHQESAPPPPATPIKQEVTSDWWDCVVLTIWDDEHTEWWDRIVMQMWDDEQWVQNFRMWKATFLELCSELAPALRRKDTNMRSALTVEKRVAIALWKMAIPDCYRSVANQFGVGRSTVGVALTQVCTAINRVLLRRTVTLGNVSEIVDGFDAMGFPNCGGAIDGTHIPILAPDHLATEYINRKGYFSMVLQALVDHRGRFTDINAGWSGKVHDARIFRNSGLKITVGDVEMPTVILGDPAYPLMPWLMKPYTGSLDQSKERFNYRLSRSRMTVECAFGRLKGRWRCLYGRLDLSENNIPAVIASCCVLHNICENQGERFCPVWETEAQRLEEAYEQPATRSIRGDKGEASRIREALREHFSHALP